MLMLTVVSAYQLFFGLNSSSATPGHALHLQIVDPDQLASGETNRSGSTLFVIKHVNLYQQPRSSNLISWKLEVGMAS